MLVKSFRNIPGIDLCNVRRLSLLMLAPGGHLGRFIIWTESAFKALDRIFGTLHKNSRVKMGFRIPRPVMSNTDLQRIINSDEIQSALRPKKKKVFQARKRNPLKNLGAMIKLNPFYLSQKRRNIKLARKSIVKAKERKDKLAKQIEEAKKRKATVTKVKERGVKKPKVVREKKEKAKVKKLWSKPKASKRFLKVLNAPAMAPKRGPEEITPKYQ